MRNLQINKRQLYALKYKGKVEITDSEGNYTGEQKITYSRIIKFKAHISGAKGDAQSEIFGTEISYDKSFVLTKREFDQYKFDENTVFFIDKQPTFIFGVPQYDYRVKKIAITLNEVLVAIVKVGNDEH